MVLRCLRPPHLSFGRGPAELDRDLCVAFWGVWHFPIVHTPSLGFTDGVEVLIVLMIFQGVVEYLLSIYWRMSGNLLVPGSVHAFGSVRNGLVLL